MSFLNYVLLLQYCDRVDITALSASRLQRLLVSKFMWNFVPRQFTEIIRWSFLEKKKALLLCLFLGIALTYIRSLKENKSYMSKFMDEGHDISTKRM